MKHTKVLFVALAIAGVTACSGSGTSVAPDGEDGSRALVQIKNEAEFTDSIRSALINQYAVGGTDINYELAPDVANSTGDGTTTASEESSADSGATTSGGTNVTGTNVQEVGVDEADRVKSDGDYLYVLTPQSGDVWITDVAIAEGDQLPGGKPPVTQQQIRILSLDAESADASLVKELEVSMENEIADGLYQHKGDGFNSLILTASSMNGYWGYWESSEAFGGQRSSIRKINVQDPANANVTDRLSFGGQIVSSRRVDDHLYVVSRYYPKVNGLYYGGDRFEIEEIVNNTPLSDLMPSVTKNSTELGSLVDPSNCFASSKSASEYYSPDIITLFTVNLADMSVTDAACYLGASDALYASTNAVYLATTEYNYGPEVLFVDTVEPGDGVVEEEPERPVSSEETDPEVGAVPPENYIKTNIHQFDFSAGNLSYRGSGRVDGHLGWNPLQKSFRMSEKDGYLRVTTFSDGNNASVSPVFMSVLQPAGGNSLNVVAKLPNSNRPAHIGKPGERLHASRFLGDKAYLVTFRQTDPLYVVDMSNPADPFIAGELEIEGYSDYLQPIGDNHLLGIGKGAIPSSNGSPDEGGRGAFATGVKVSLFDVSNPANPREVNSIEIGKRGSHSEALNDHHGITVQHRNDGQPARLSFGIDVADIPQGDTGQPWAWYGWRETGLHAFEINTGANAGISEHGKMIVEGRTDGQYWGPSRYGDRSVMVNDAVFYIHGEQVFGANWNSLGNFSGPR